jgi:hypothetical protein
VVPVAQLVKFSGLWSALCPSSHRSGSSSSSCRIVARLGAGIGGRKWKEIGGG